MHRCAQVSSLSYPFNFVTELEGADTNVLQYLPMMKVERTDIHAGKLKIASQNFFDFVV
jgi:hypothetical protein